METLKLYDGDSNGILSLKTGSSKIHRNLRTPENCFLISAMTKPVSNIHMSEILTEN